MQNPTMRILIILVLLGNALHGYGQKKIIDSFRIHVFPDLQLDYPQADGITYNQFIGETIGGFFPADGWRTDTLNGGMNKKVHRNPYLELLDRDRFIKQPYNKHYQFFLYKKGKKFSGEINDTLVSHYANRKILFKANCMESMVQGKASLILLNNNELLATAHFEDGELVGECINYDRKYGNPEIAIFQKVNGKK